LGEKEMEGISGKYILPFDIRLKENFKKNGFADISV
jgi:hypothetical protein